MYVLYIILKNLKIGCKKKNSLDLKGCKFPHSLMMSYDSSLCSSVPPRWLGCLASGLVLQTTCHRPVPPHTRTWDSLHHKEVLTHTFTTTYCILYQHITWYRKLMGGIFLNIMLLLYQMCTELAGREFDSTESTRSSVLVSGKPLVF